MTYGEGLYTAERIRHYRQMFQKAESLLAEGIRSCSTPPLSASATVSGTAAGSTRRCGVLASGVLVPEEELPTRARGTGAVLTVAGNSLPSSGRPSSHFEVPAHLRSTRRKRPTRWWTPPSAGCRG
jgi:hypothetical protein